MTVITNSALVLLDSTVGSVDSTLDLDMKVRDSIYCYGIIPYAKLRRLAHIDGLQQLCLGTRATWPITLNHGHIKTPAECLIV